MTEKELAAAIESAKIFDAKDKIIVIKSPNRDAMEIQHTFEALRQRLKNSGSIFILQGDQETLGCIDLREGKTMHNEFDAKELAKILRKAANLISK